MNKKQIDKMVRVDFCDNQDYKIKLYNKYGINKKQDEKVLNDLQEVVVEEVKKQPPVKDYYPDY